MGPHLFAKILEEKELATQMEYCLSLPGLGASRESPRELRGPAESGVLKYTSNFCRKL